jgi:hypothetical protein
MEIGVDGCWVTGDPGDKGDAIGEVIDDDTDDDDDCWWLLNEKGRILGSSRFNWSSDKLSDLWRCLRAKYAAVVEAYYWT